MFNGYNETPLISYDFNQERIEKKQDNAGKWSYPPNPGIQTTQMPHASDRHPEFWPGKPNLVGVSNVVKCTCSGCFTSPENQSYQGENARHRPWLPRTFPVPLNGSNESCKLPGYQWDNGFSNQNLFYQNNTLSHVQENGGKHPYYRTCQNSRLTETNQPGVITSIKNAEYGKKTNGELSVRGESSPILNGTRQPVLCNPAYSLNKRTECANVNEKYANATSYSLDPHVPKLPVVEPFIKAVPSNLSQNRVPSTGYRSVKENMPQSYIDPGYGDLKKHCTEPGHNGEKRNEIFSPEQSGVRVECSYRNLPENEPQKFFFENSRPPEYFARNSNQEVNKRNTQLVDLRRDYPTNQIGEEHYNKNKYLEGGSSKSSCELNSGCFQDGKSENVHSGLARNALMFNDQRTQPSYFYQSNPPVYKNYLRPDYPYQNFNPQTRYEYPAGYQNQCRITPQQLVNCDTYSSQFPVLPSETNYLTSPVKALQLNTEKNPSLITTDLSCCLDKKPNYLEAIRSEEINKNGTNKISPLRLLRKKKLINVPQESVPSNKFDSVPGLDVRKFWSTWAEEEEENVAPTQMVVLDCQEIDPEQAKLLQLYETNSVHDFVLKETELVKEPSMIQQADETGKTLELEPKPENTKIKEMENAQPKKENLNHALDNWTEKKFDFLKRAEESKTVEQLRHEEEKKEMLETTQTLQQKADKASEKCWQIDEKLLSDESGVASCLPTSEYRRNKFLDYHKTIPNDGETPGNMETGKSENYALDVKDNVFEDILNNISEINFSKPEDEDISEKRSPVKKLKKKKQEPAVENDRERKDKVTVETVTKPTIKFSIQKSHDLKISFKVLNSKEYSNNEELRKSDLEQKGTEDAKNSTELITLKYKSIQREGMELKKARKKKKDGESKKSSKTKRSRCVPEEKALLEDDSSSMNPHLEREDFQVQETMDSAKIKLTFKRHKGNFETEYKINESPSETYEPLGTTTTTTKDKKKSRRAKKHGKIFAESGVEPFQNCETSDVRSESEVSEDDEPTSFTQDSIPNSEMPLSPVAVSESDTKMEDVEMEPVVLSMEHNNSAEFKKNQVFGDEDCGFDFSLVDCVEDLKKSPMTKEDERSEKKKENEEVSFDFITSPNTEEININHKHGETSTTIPKFPIERENESLEIFSPFKTETVMEEENVVDTENGSKDMEPTFESVADGLMQKSENDSAKRTLLAEIKEDRVEDTVKYEEKQETHKFKPRVFNFPTTKINRRHSMDCTAATWSKKKFLKAKSCPPEIEFQAEDIPVENIPLPIGPPNFDSFFFLRKRGNESNYTEAKEKPKELISDRGESHLSPIDQVLEVPSSGLFQRSKNSKIKFSFLKKSKISKIPTTNDEIKNAKPSQAQEVPTKANVEEVLPCEDLDESVEIMSDFIREELYEDIPTSEDQDDAETEKVNDDKFRNIMQNCLDNAKKFLNVGNLKLFSCSVDDLLELDFQGAEKDEPEMETSHISRDVFLTSCEDDNDDLELPENTQVPEMNTDFLPSALESDTCPEILPVNNWPYLEEEVPSSPIKANENDVMTSFEFVSESETCKRKRVASESFVENSKDKWKTPRRKTIESITETSCSRHDKLLRKTEFKCKLSLEKLSKNRFRFELENNARNLNYKSATWQPKVILFRISNSELKNVLKPNEELGAKGGHDVEVKKLEEQTETKHAKEAFELDFIKGSFNTSVGDVGRKRKKSRFRNLHTKRKAEGSKILDVSKEKSLKDGNYKKDDRKQDEIKYKHRLKHGEQTHGMDSPKIERKTPKVWTCEVCGFDDPDERVSHIKSHPFHCQSCHLAFKTESHFTEHLTKKHKDIRNQHHCLLCELSFDTEEQYSKHLETREHRHLESVEKNTINTLFTILTGGPCPVLGLADVKPEWLPNQAGTVHFYHQATPLSLALQYLKMHRDLSFYSATSSTHPS